MGKAEGGFELDTLDDNTLNIADPGDKNEEAIFFKLPAEIVCTGKWRPLTVCIQSHFDY